MYNLLKMNRYQLQRNRIFLLSISGFLLLGFVLADTYLAEVMGPGGGPAVSLTYVMEAMVYDSTLPLVLISTLLSLFLGQEFSHRTIHQEICAGHPRASVFAGKVITYLAACNLMALVYPLGGCIREFYRFGIGNVPDFLFHGSRVILQSILFNSAFLMLPVFFCFCFRRTEAALAVSALVTFITCLYLGYGLMLGYPVRFLPIFQIRAGITGVPFMSMEGLLVAALWLGILIPASWLVFRKCELK